MFSLVSPSRRGHSSRRLNDGRPPASHREGPRVHRASSSDLSRGATPRGRRRARARRTFSGRSRRTGFSPRATETAPGGISLASTMKPDASKARKPYTITKSRESWTEKEHNMFLEAINMCVAPSPRPTPPTRERKPWNSVRRIRLSTVDARPLTALSLPRRRYDRDWKKIETYVGTKTVIQIRSHAQKYFLKVRARQIPPPRRTRRPSGRRRGRNVNRPPPRCSNHAVLDCFFFDTRHPPTSLSLSPIPGPHRSKRTARASTSRRRDRNASPRRRTRKNPTRAARHRAEGREPRRRRPRRKPPPPPPTRERERLPPPPRRPTWSAGTTSTSTPRVGCKVRAGRGKGGAWARGATRSPARGR